MATTLRTQDDISGTTIARPLGDLVARAAALAPDAVAVPLPESPVTFGGLVATARSAMTSLAPAPAVDDANLTIALMMTVPGLATSGPSGLADILTAVRASATVVVGTADRTR